MIIADVTVSPNLGRYTLRWFLPTDNTTSTASLFENTTTTTPQRQPSINQECQKLHPQRGSTTLLPLKLPPPPTPIPRPPTPSWQDGLWESSVKRTLAFPLQFAISTNIWLQYRQHRAPPGHPLEQRWLWRPSSPRGHGGSRHLHPLLRPHRNPS